VIFGFGKFILFFYEVFCFSNKSAITENLTQIIKIERMIWL